MQIKESLGLTNRQVEGKDQASSVGKAGRQATSSGTEAQAAATDKVELSGRSRDMARAADAVSSAPTVREQKVADIKSRIASNEYEIDADKIAHKMIVDFLGELV